MSQATEPGRSKWQTRFRSQSFIVEYCEYSLHPNKCNLWLKVTWPDIHERLYGLEKVARDFSEISVEEKDVKVEDNGGKKRQTRGGKVIPKDEVKRIEKEEQKRKKARVIIRMVERNKRKSITQIRGLDGFGLDLKLVAKRCASKFACGCSVVQSPGGYDEVVIQGDFVEVLATFIPEEWPEVPEDQIDISEK